MTVHVDWTARCAGLVRPVTVSFVAEDVEVTPDGVFAAAGPLESPVAVGTYSLLGAFSAPKSAFGTGHAAFTVHRDERDIRCRTPSVDWETRTAGRLHGPSTPLREGGYFGSTGQTFPVILRVSKDGGSVAQAALLWDASCPALGATFGGPTVTGPIPIGGDGSFGSRGRSIQSWPPGRLAVTTWAFSGRFGTETAAGTWQATVAVRDAHDRSLLDTCPTGRVPWGARN